MEENINIPDGWTISSFGDNNFKIIGSGVKYFENSKDYLSTSSVERDNVLFVEEEITFKNRPSRANMQPIENSIWFAKMKNTLKIFYPKKDDLSNVILSTGFCGIYSSNVEISLIKQILLSKSFNSQKDLLAEGSTQEAVNNFKVKQIKFLLPENRKEQSKIAEILSKVDKAISETEIIIAKYNRIKTGLMQDLLTKGIDEKGNIRSEETHEFKDSPLGRIPKEWSVKNLGELITAIDPQPDHRTPPQVLDGIPYLGISDFTSSGNIDEINCRKVGHNVLIKQTNSFNIDEGDIIFGKIGTIGKPKKLPNFEKSPFTLSANVILIKPIECPAFIYWALISDYVNIQVSLATHSTSQPAFGMEKIRALKIITPQPKERDVITEKLNAFENIFSEEEKKLSKLKSIKTGLMQDLLSGKKRVTHLIN